jgi:hypothetical protein
MPRYSIGPYGPVPHTADWPPDAEAPGPLPAESEVVLTGRPHEDLSWLRRWALTGPDPARDVRRYAAPPPARSPLSPPVVGWLHVATIGAWRPILMELLSAVERSGLLSVSSRVFVGVVGPEADLSWLPQWAEVVKRDGPLEMGENSTLEALWGWSKSAEPSRVWYLHTKGASHGANPNVTAWRDYLTYWNILRWRECLAALETHDACGADYVEIGPEAQWFVDLWGAARLRPGSRGFPGNFWWVNSQYLASMPATGVTLDRDRWDAEWAMIGAGRPRVKVFHEARVNFYNSYYPRDRYEIIKPRGSLADAVRAARECVPCRESKTDPLSP